MKKTLIAVAAAAALTATSAFAEITFGAWLRVITGVGSNGEDVVMGTTNSWGGVRPARLNAAGTSEDGKAGFKLDFYFENDEIWGHDKNIRIGDNGYLWVKPIDQIQLSIGKFDGGETGFRGDFCYGSWNWLRPYNWIVEDEGLTFRGSHKDGLMARITPIDNLVVLVQLPVMSAKWGGNNAGYVAKTGTEDAKNTAADVFKNAAYMAAYSIEGLGTLKAGFFGDYQESGDYKKTGTVNVAFDLNAIENLYVTVGAFFDIADKEMGEWHEKMKFTAGASYQVSDAMKFSVSGGYVKYMDKCAWLGNKDNAFQIGAGVDYVIMDGLTLNADVRYKNVGYGKDKDDGSVSFLAGVVKSVGGNASLQAGFQGSTNGCGLVQADTGIPAVENDDFVWAIPVGLSVFF
ncbi:porin [Treponema succinifaciens]|uniref:porin n=1 Tax=Treponema succinifaciens TaxID=167 RepID=UPI0023F5486A|nr:porin [Treponema succinifaciens]